MSTPDLTPAAPPPASAAPQTTAPERGFSPRALLIGLVAALAVGAVAVLSVGAGATGLPGQSTLVLAPAAFLAGIFSFLSPCTLPILPAYFAFTFQARRERVVLMTVMFFLGLATTIVVLGASATALSQLFFRQLSSSGAVTEIPLGFTTIRLLSVLDLVQLVGGLVVVVFGLMSMVGRGFTGLRLLDRPTAGAAGAFLYGATFAFGWTACVGPIYGALLTLLTTQGIAVVQGAVLAFIYALGLGMPLIIVASFFSRLGTGSRFWRLIRGRGFELNLGFTRLHLHSTSVLSGLMLVLVGTLLATGQLSVLSQWSQSTPMGQWAISIEQGIERLFFGR
ncbi:MAG TPA: cytochrome c biogenesis protein CcdA [Roseiflexaceae bacterium]|nr:cytochrome c biogenesis protein CcdA [Roseiflexaceae bacterium]